MWKKVEIWWGVVYNILCRVMSIQERVVNIENENITGASAAGVGGISWGGFKF